MEAPDYYIAKLRKAIAKFEESNMPEGATGEIRRVVHRFAVIAAAGEAASSEKLTGWAPGEASAGVATCVKAWLVSRGATGRGHDEEQMIRQARHFIESHRSSRFRQLTSLLEPPDYNGPIHRMAGYYRNKDGQTTYYFQTEVFRSEVCKDWDYKQVLSVLKRGKYLIHDSSRLDKQIKGPRMPRETFYAVNHEILLGEDDNTSEDEA